MSVITWDKSKVCDPIRQLWCSQCPGSPWLAGADIHGAQEIREWLDRCRPVVRQRSHLTIRPRAGEVNYLSHPQNFFIQSFATNILVSENYLMYLHDKWEIIVFPSIILYILSLLLFWDLAKPVVEITTSKT